MINAMLDTYAQMARTIFADTHGYGPNVYDQRAWRFARQAWHSFMVAEAVEELCSNVVTRLRANLATGAERFATIFFAAKQRLEHNEFAPKWQREQVSWAVDSFDDLELSDQPVEPPPVDPMLDIHLN